MCKYVDVDDISSCLFTSIKSTKYKQVKTTGTTIVEGVRWELRSGRSGTGPDNGTSTVLHTCLTNFIYLFYQNHFPLVRLRRHEHLAVSASNQTTTMSGVNDLWPLALTSQVMTILGNVISSESSDDWNR